MIYEGKAITVQALEDGIVELKFDLQGESVNKFNRATLAELQAAIEAISAGAAPQTISEMYGECGYGPTSALFWITDPR